ncbi:MAG: ligase-associated DNA damage response DEXH box helicase [Cyclobacteriaceae bacterium]|nr:ligase-associated DNA damage response DEXH box helicase [Cyclobacteriaceae bacterium]
MKKSSTSTEKNVEAWFSGQGWKPFLFQKKVWKLYKKGYSGLLNAPTGSGKTYALWLAFLKDFANQKNRPRKGPMVIWITPLRALATDLKKAMDKASEGLEPEVETLIRTGDTLASEKQKMMRKPPHCLITTPETLHILFSGKSNPTYFQDLRLVVVDEWHELMGTKRGSQTELALAWLRHISPDPLKIWGISATIGNLKEALDALMGPSFQSKAEIVKADIKKEIEVRSIIPETIDNYPWAGHLGLKLLADVVPVILQSKSTLLFTNTRNQAETWYRSILEEAPELAGAMALHHGSLEKSIREWVENELRLGKLKLVVCTSSLDLGVDFSPVDTVIQVGGPKGVSRFMQRAGRSGHQPGAKSYVYFVPTHALELVESAALQKAMNENLHEARKPVRLSMDVLVQFMVTLAAGPGFRDPDLYNLVVSGTYAYSALTQEAWQWALLFITTGGKSLEAYEEFAKVEIENGIYTMKNKRNLLRHRLSIGTIVSDPVLKVKFQTGGYIGSVEESFIAMLKVGDSFWFAGRSLEFIRVKDMTVWVKNSQSSKGIVPRWMGGRMPLSSQLAGIIRQLLDDGAKGILKSRELKALEPLLQKQAQLSEIPGEKALLLEKIISREGFHLFVYPFEGRFVHEILASIVALRLGRIKPITFSIAMNDYGFELLSDQEIPVEEALELDLFSRERLDEDLLECINRSELARRKFRDIATISGLIFTGFPGKGISNKHLQASSQIIYKVFETYDPDNLLIKQARDEVISLQLDIQRLYEAIDRIQLREIHLQQPERFTPFCFPIMVDRLREKLSTEKLIDRIMRLQKSLNEQKPKAYKSTLN